VKLLGPPATLEAERELLELARNGLASAVPIQPGERSGMRKGSKVRFPRRGFTNLQKRPAEAAKVAGAAAAAVKHHGASWTRADRLGDLRAAAVRRKRERRSEAVEGSDEVGRRRTWPLPVGIEAQAVELLARAGFPWGLRAVLRNLPIEAQVREFVSGSAILSVRRQCASCGVRRHCASSPDSLGLHGLPAGAERRGLWLSA
jgi:hypothetical protein